MLNSIFLLFALQNQSSKQHTSLDVITLSTNPERKFHMPINVYKYNNKDLEYICFCLGLIN